MPLSQVIERAEDTVLRKAELDFAAAAEPFPGAAVGRFGSTLATRLAELPQHVPYNKARPFRQEQRDALHEMLAFYRDHGVPPALEVRAGDAGDARAPSSPGVSTMPPKTATSQSSPSHSPPPSHENLARLGFQTTHTRTVWQ